MEGRGTYEAVKAMAKEVEGVLSRNCVKYGCKRK
jgi:hypothetical protein